MKVVALASILAAFALSGCAHTPAPAPKIVVKPVNLPVAVSCDIDVGPQPAYPDTDAALKAAPDHVTRVKLLLAGRLLRSAREARLLAARAACAG